MTRNFRFFTAILFTILVALGVFIFLNIKQQSKGNGLPLFTFLTLNNEEFTSEKLPNMSQYVILYFSPDCDYCLKEIVDISKNKKFFRNTFFVLVSPSSSTILKEFNKSMLSSGLNYIILNDSEFNFGKYFGTASIPSTFIYDKNKNLISKNQGGTTAKLIYSNF